MGGTSLENVASELRGKMKVSTFSIPHRYYLWRCVTMKHNIRFRYVAVLGLGLFLLLLWGYFTVLLELQPESTIPSHLVMGACGKFLLFPMAICLFSFVFWTLLLQVKQLNLPTKRTRRIFAVVGLVLPGIYFLSMPCLFFSTPFQAYFEAVFPTLDRLLYSPLVLCAFVADMLPFAIALAR